MICMLLFNVGVEIRVFGEGRVYRAGIRPGVKSIGTGNALKRGAALESHLPDHNETPSELYALKGGAIPKRYVSDRLKSVRKNDLGKCRASPECRKGDSGAFLYGDLFCRVVIHKRIREDHKYVVSLYGSGYGDAD